MDDPATLLRRAEALLRQGRSDEAIEAYETLLALRPRDADSWYNLGYLRRVARRFEAALDAYARALEAGIRRPEEVHLNRAAILSEYLERPDEAEAELKRAVERNPRFLQAWLNLGNLHEDRGAPAAAREAYERALAVAPANGRAHARLAAIDVFLGEAGRVPDRLAPLLDGGRLGGEDEAEIAFALGNALDALGDYDRAFEAFGRANAAARAAGAAQGFRYDRRAAEQLVDRIVATFPLAAAPAAAPAGTPPLFVCGMFRSGSTLAEQILGRHSRVTAGGELEFLPALVYTRLQPYPDAAARVSQENLETLRGAYLGELHALFPAADLVTDKRPDNFLHIGLIKAMFPEARIVHTVRSPLDNILSIYFLYFDSSVAYGFDLGDIAHWYRQYRRLMAHWRGLYGADIHDFDYDAAVADPRAEVGRLLDFCGLDWEEGCLATRDAGTAVRTASVWQVRRPIHARSSGRWRNYERHLGVVRAMLEDLEG